jgi:hypothetical protein
VGCAAVSAIYDDCLVTDESELHDFITDETPPDFEERFASRYGFALSDDDDLRVVRILGRIADQRHSTECVN